MKKLLKFVVYMGLWGWLEYRFYSQLDPDTTYLIFLLISGALFLQLSNGVSKIKFRSREYLGGVSKPIGADTGNDQSSDAVESSRYNKFSEVMKNGSMFRFSCFVVLVGNGAMVAKTLIEFYL